MRAGGKLLVIVAATALLTWAEWVKNHPPEIALVALLHLVVVSLIVWLFAYIVGKFRRTARSAPDGRREP